MWALGYAVAGMGLGFFMAALHNHAQHVTHAHIMLVDFVVSLIYAVIHKLWLSGKTGKLAKFQFFVHQGGSLALLPGLLLMYGAVYSEVQVEPLLAAGSITVFFRHVDDAGHGVQGEQGRLGPMRGRDSRTMSGLPRPFFCAGPGMFRAGCVLRSPVLHYHRASAQ